MYATSSSALAALQGATTDPDIRHALTTAAYLVYHGNVRAAKMVLTQAPAPWDSDVIAAAMDITDEVAA